MKKYIAEYLGTFLLVATVIGSGIMAENLISLKDYESVVLLCNTIATGAILYVIIKMFGDISGAHFNPAVSFVFLIKDELSWKEFCFYIVAQLLGGLLGVFLIHYIFEQPSIIQVSEKARLGWPLFVSEILATWGLICTILFVRDNDSKSVAISVALFITAGYWFTSSTSFANPAVSLARVFTNTFTGISPNSLAPFVYAQFLGCLFGLFTYKYLKN